MISQANLTTKIVDLNKIGITQITSSQSKPSLAANSALININPVPKISKNDTNKAKISISGIKKNQRVKVTISSK